MHEMNSLKKFREKSLAAKASDGGRGRGGGLFNIANHCYIRVIIYAT